MKETSEVDHINSVEIFADIDQQVGTERYNREQRAERLTRKLELIMADWDLSFELDAYLRQLILPGRVDQMKMSQEQAERINKVAAQTIRSAMSPADLEAVEREMEHWRWKESQGLNKSSPFAGW